MRKGAEEDEERGRWRRMRKEGGEVGWGKREGKEDRERGRGRRIGKEGGEGGWGKEREEKRGEEEGE